MAIMVWKETIMRRGMDHLGFISEQYWLLISFISFSSCSSGASSKQRCSFSNPLSSCSRQTKVDFLSSWKISSQSRLTQASGLGSAAMERQYSFSSNRFSARVQFLHFSGFSAATCRSSLRRFIRTLGKRLFSSISTNPDSSTCGSRRMSLRRASKDCLLLRQPSETSRQTSSLIFLLRSQQFLVASLSMLSKACAASPPIMATSTAFLPLANCAICIILRTVKARLSSEGSTSRTSPLRSLTSSITHSSSRAMLCRAVICSSTVSCFPCMKSYCSLGGTRATMGTQGALRQNQRIIAKPFPAYYSGLSSLLFLLALMATPRYNYQFCPAGSHRWGISSCSAGRVDYHLRKFHFIVIIYSMLFNPRKKQSSSSVLNLTVLADSPIDESFADSIASKRFTRKKNSSNEHARNLRAHRPSDVSAAQIQCIPKETLKTGKGSTSSFKPEDLFLRITHTPTKSKNSYTPASSDRATESTYLKSRYQTEYNLVQGAVGRRECPLQLKEELDLKTSELMLLEDEIMRLKRDLGSKEQEYLKASIKKEKEYQAEVVRLGEELQQLRTDLQERNAEIRHFKKAEAVLNREIKALKYDKLLLEKQLEEIYKKRLPKQLKELMSFRELSLTRQVEELKGRLQESKSDHEIKLQGEIHKLKHEGSERGDSIKKLEVHCRMLSRRIIELEDDLKEKADQFSKFYVAMRDSNNDLKEQLKKARKENLKLIRLHTLNHGTSSFRPQAHHRKKAHNNIRSSSEESLSLSLSSNN